MVSIFDLLKIGIGPSSSHTIGPMKAARSFALACGDAKGAARLTVTLYGSLAWTGAGHATDKAIVLGLAGEMPETVDPDNADKITEDIRASRAIRLAGKRAIAFDAEKDIIFDRLVLKPLHSNAMSFSLLDAAGKPLLEQVWYSTGGGFVQMEGGAQSTADGAKPLPFPFRSGVALLEMGADSNLSIAQIVRANEHALRAPEEVSLYLQRIIDTMMACVERGMRTGGVLPGGLNVRRRAASLHKRLEADRASNSRAPHEAMEYVSLFAIAVNEENAAGGRVVTAPTNGAAGVVPAVLRYYRDFCPGASQAGMEDFLLTATAIGGLFKMNASISGAEVGCQGEVGVACSMAAGGLAAALGGTNQEIENAAEIGMEHHLGMTCDPIGGLVQIPCIERNAFGAVKAINAASLALRGDGEHQVSLDKVIATMRQTGADMQAKYKETSQGGLAVNVTEC